MSVGKATLLGLIAIFILIAPSSPARSDDVAPECTQLLKLASTMGREVDGVFINKDVCDAYRFLLERNGTGDRGSQCYKSQTDRILKLNPQFAVGLAKALAEMERLYGGRNIVQSGFRCDGSNGNHPKGCAADIIWASCQAKVGGSPENAWRCASDSFDSPEQKWIDANGKNAPYNIHLRLRYAPEGHHVEPVNTQGCRTGAVVGSGIAAPLGGALGNALRSALGGQQQQPQAAQMAIPSRPVSVSQSPLQAFQEPSTVPTPGVSMQITGGGATAQTPSIVDTLEELAFGPKTPTSTVTSTGTTVPLVVSGSQAVGIVSTAPATGSPHLPSGVSGISSQTFISGDLNWQGGTAEPTQPLSGWDAFFATLRATLNRILQLLVPFGAREEVYIPEYDY